MAVPPDTMGRRCGPKFKTQQMNTAKKMVINCKRVAACRERRVVSVQRQKQRLKQIHVHKGNMNKIRRFLNVGGSQTHSGSKEKVLTVVFVSHKFDITFMSISCLKAAANREAIESPNEGFCSVSSVTSFPLYVPIKR